MIAVTIAWTVAFFFANLLQCLPLSVNWNALGYMPGACINTSQMYLAQGHSDIWTDGELCEKKFLYALRALIFRSAHIILADTPSKVIESHFPVFLLIQY